MCQTASQRIWRTQKNPPFSHLHPSHQVKPDRNACLWRTGLRDSLLVAWQGDGLAWRRGDRRRCCWIWLLWVFLWQCLSWLLWGVRTKQSASILPQKLFALRRPSLSITQRGRTGSGERRRVVRIFRAPKQILERLMMTSMERMNVFPILKAR